MKTERSPQREVMRKLQEKWGTVRREPGDHQVQRQEYLESNFQPFFQPLNATVAEDPVRLDQLEEFREHLKEMKREEKWSLLQDRDEDPEPPSDRLPPTPSGETHQEKRMDLLGEIAKEQFRSGMLSWLTTVPTDDAFSSSSIEELEEIEKQARYRLNVVEVLQHAMQQELDGVKKELRAKRIAFREESRILAGEEL